MEIPRWTPKYLAIWKESDAMSPATHGGYVDYSDHVAAMQAARPQPKFKVGDRVAWKRMQGSRIVESSIFRPYNNTYEYYIEGTGELCLWEHELEFYVPPVTTSLREHESVRYDDHSAAIKAAVLAERVRCLEIVENIHGCVVGIDGYLRLDPYGELVSRSRVETAIRWVKVK